MTNLIPRFIVDKAEGSEREGSFDAFSLFLDVSGFTAMTEDLIQRGKSGAEALSRIINEVFEPVLKLLYGNGGFVTTFAGDAFTAIFPRGEGFGADKILKCTLALMDEFATNPLHKTPWGEYLLKAKVGLGCGDLHWGILESENRLGYYFRGPAVDGAAQAEHRCRAGEIAYSKNLEGMAVPADASEERQAEGFLIFTPRITGRPSTDKDEENPDGRAADEAAAVSRDLLRRFLPEEHFPRQTRGEFRDISSVFIAFEERGRDLNDFFAATADLAERNGGYFNLLDFGDKGGIALVLFGAPISLEHGLSRAMDFALDLKHRFGDLRIGIAQGQCFAGYVGSDLRSTYTALGQVVNLSSRLAMSAAAGEILLPAGGATSRYGRYRFEHRGESFFKGFDAPQKVLSLEAKDGRVVRTGGRGVGRRNECTILGERLTELVEGTYIGGIAVLGEAGIGKTQLISDVQTRLIEQGLELQSEQFTFDPVFKGNLIPFSHYFRERISPEGQSAEKRVETFNAMKNNLLSPDTPDYLRNEINRAAPGLFSLMELPVDDKAFASLDAQARHDRVLEALVAYFSLLARKRPLLLIIDQAQALDDGSAEFLDRLISRDKDLPVGVLYAARLSTVASLPGVDEKRALILRPFSEDESRELVVQELDAVPEVSLLNFIGERTENVPLYITELLRYLRDRGLLRMEAGRVELSSVNPSALPSTLEALILSQVDNLSPGIKDLLPQMAVLGNRFSLPILLAAREEGSEAAPSDGESVAGLLETAELAGVLRRLGNDEFAFQKSMLRESVYGLQLEERLGELHARAALAFEKIYTAASDHSFEKAYHFHKAGNPGSARDYYRLAGDGACRDYLNTQALSCYDSYLALSEDDRESSLVRLEKARILELIGDWEASRRELERGLGLASIAGEEGLYHQFFALLGQISFKKGDTALARTYFEKALRDPRNSGINSTLVEIRIDLARVHMLDGEYGDALSRLFEAMDLAREKGFRLEEGLSFYYIGSVYRTRGRRAKALDAYEKSLAIFKELNIARYIANPLYDLGLIHLNEGQLTRSKEYFSEVLDMYSQIGYKSGLAAALINLGAAADQKGEFDEAMDFYRRSRHIAEEIGEKPGMGYALFCLGANAFKKREYGEAVPYLLDALRLFESIELVTYYGYPLSYLASTYARMGRGDDVVDTVHRLVQIVDRTGNDPEKGRSFMALAEVFEHRLEMNTESLRRVRKIAKKTGIDRIGASAFYRKAIEESKNPRYVSTLIPALFQFGEYLISRISPKDDGSRAMDFVRRALKEAERAGWIQFVGKIRDAYPEVDAGT